MRRRKPLAPDTVSVEGEAAGGDVNLIGCCTLKINVRESGELPDVVSSALRRLGRRGRIKGGGSPSPSTTPPQ